MIPVNKKKILLKITIYNSLLSIGLIHAFTIHQADVQQGMVITQAGNWQLEGPVTFNGQYAISINTDNVVIDLQGYTINGQDTGKCAINITGNNCQIINGTIQQTTDTAIQINNVSGTVISKISLQNVLSGISVANGEVTSIDTCSITQSQTTGIVISDSTYTNLSNISISEGGAGITINGSSDGSAISKAHIHQCTTNGINIQSNMISLNGIIIYNIVGDGVLLTGNSIRCKYVNSSLNTGNGFTIYGQNNNLTVCFASTNGGDGILLTSSSANTSIIGGLSSGNANIGINNLGATSNTASYVDTRVNQIRDLWRIMATS